ncbi:MAG TPA: hypothetical protein VF676_01930 [Flavobacterium sp.]|jgi:hypothetical protein
MFKFINKLPRHEKQENQVDKDNSATDNTMQNDSLMHLIYQSRVKAGLIPNNQNCESCICFGDEWPL